MTRTQANAKNPPSGDVAWWDQKSKALLAFLSAPRSWKEIRAWGKARKLGSELHIDNQVAHLHNTKQVRPVAGHVTMWITTVACDTCARRGWVVQDRKKQPCTCGNAKTPPISVAS